MATILLTAVGTIVGGPLGGAIGALVGRQIDSAIIGGGRGAEGPRLKELTVQTSSYGSPLPLHFGHMRAAGTVIWSTELIEHREKQGGGKGRPSVTTFSYTASFAVALASRPIAGIGRVWADGNLLRGSAGDLKVGGQMRVHTGHGDQGPDPLMVQAEGADRCPAFRNTAYVVFEDLELADFGNRLPSLTFEIIADEGGVTLADIVAAITPEASLALSPRLIEGFSIDRGTTADCLGTVDRAFPLACNAWGETLSIGDAEARPVGGVPELPAPASARDDSETGHQTGASRRRAAQPRARLCGLRYYDVDRDYQLGMQRGRGRAEPGELAISELPAALAARDARAIADAASRRTVRPAETARYRIAELDARFGPGRTVVLPGRSGVWRVEQWEWQTDGVSLQLTRLPPFPAIADAAADPGRLNPPADLAAVPTILAACELPWDGAGASDRPAIYVGAGGSSAGWTGAALFVTRSDGSLVPLGPTGRRRAIIGSSLVPLPAASALLVDSLSVLDIQLAAQDQALADASFVQLSEGANRALVGSEIIQFGRAEPLGSGTWRLSQLLRGRGGTEQAIASHAAGERFLLLDDSLIPLDPLTIGDAATCSIIASGLADEVPVTSVISEAGVTLRPLSPVHGRIDRSINGDMTLSWIRRARGAWIWRDGVETPLNEQVEVWEVSLVNTGSPAVVWKTSASSLALSPTQAAIAVPGACFEIRQVGSHSRSLPLVVPVPA